MNTHRSFTSSFAACQSFVVISVKTGALGSCWGKVTPDSSCRYSGCCHDIGGGCSACVCVCVYACARMPGYGPYTSWSLIRLAPLFTLEGVASLVWLTRPSHRSSRCQKLHCTVRTSLREQSLARELPIQTEPNQSSRNPAWLWPPVDCLARSFPMPAA